ncbi:MAG: iron-containing alcohol dehydrogenase [Spirochaetes bacterium]|nr:iron-containing alcohol dehydrogenase [Spirochaetota bacterium]
MTSFDYSIQAALKFGVDVINRIGNLVSEFGSKAIIVTEGILHESGTIKRVSELIEKKDCQVLIFDEVVPNAMSDIVDYGSELARSSYANVIVGIGGIRTLSIAKAIAMLSANKGSINDYIDKSRTPSADSLPYIEIPSTPRNPFMFKDQLYLVNAKDRNSVILNVKEGTTKYVLFDPMITTTLPRRFTATTIIYALANAIEGYISTKSNFLSDTLFLTAIKLFNENIFNAVNMAEDINSRANLGLGGLLTCLGLNMASTGIAAAVSFVLSGKYRIHKSLSISVLLPHIMDYNITSVPVKLVKIAENLGQDISNLSTVEASIKAVEKIRKMIIELQLPTRLEEFGLKKDDLISIADDARQLEMFNYIPRTCSSEELYEILLSSY